jgi:hypothetical protein
MLYLTLRLGGRLAFLLGRFLVDSFREHGIERTSGAGRIFGGSTFRCHGLSEQ